MERREDIRAAMQSLLSPPARRPENSARVMPPPITLPLPAFQPVGETLSLSESQKQVLGELQVTLRENGIAAELPDILQAMIEALTARPMLCRGLIAAYLLGEC